MDVNVLFIKYLDDLEELTDGDDQSDRLLLMDLIKRMLVPKRLIDHFVTFMCVYSTVC